MTDKSIIVLDAANIGWSAGNSQCSGKGLIEVITYCRNHGLIPIAFLPNNYLYSPGKPKRLITELEDVIIEVDKGTIIPVPPRDDDDLYMITYARSKDAKLVSNDLFRDYISSSEDSVAESWVKNNVVSYTFVIGEFFPNPKFTKFFGNSVPQITQTDTPTDSVNQFVNLQISGEPEIETSAKILDVILTIDHSDIVEKALGFRYYCTICGDGFKKWKHANTHKKESGHGSYICGECKEILPSPKSAKEHQETTNHNTLTGLWVSQNDMRIKSIPDLTIELINSSSSSPDEFLRQIVLNKRVEDNKYHIWRFNHRGGGSTGRPLWPSNPKTAAHLIHTFESFRGQSLTWKECKDKLSKKLSIAKLKAAGILKTFQTLFFLDTNRLTPGTPISWNDQIIWSVVNIDGAIFERILHALNDVEWVDGHLKPEGWLEEINDYLEDVKIYYARLG